MNSMYNQEYKDSFRRYVIPALLITAAVLVCYGRTLGYGFIQTWDDDRYVTNNPAIFGITVLNLKRAFSTYYVGNYAPLHILSYMLDYTIWGLRPFGFHLSNLLLHALNGILFYLLLLRLRWRSATALLAALLFTVHPAQVESVAWVTERKNLLGLFFVLLTLITYHHSRQTATRSPRRWYILSLLAAACALLSKSIAVVLPPLLLLIDYCFTAELRPRSLLRSLLAVLPFALMAAGAAAVTMESQLQSHGGGRAHYLDGSPLLHLYTMLPVYLRYLLLVIWPANLSAVYDVPLRYSVDSAVIGGALALLAVAGLGLYLWRKQRDDWYWYAFALLAILPVSGIVPLVTFMNDRYLYVPLIGVSALAAQIVAHLAASLSGRLRYTIWGAAFLVTLILCLLSFNNTARWRDDLTLWLDAAVKAPGQSYAWAGIGNSYYLAKRFNEAIPAYKTAISLNPDNIQAQNGLGGVYALQDKFDQALPCFIAVVRAQPRYSPGFVSLGALYLQKGDFALAELNLRQALALDPNNPQAWTMFGNVLLVKKEFSAARTAFSKAQSIVGPAADISFGLACLEALAGNRDKALLHLEEALRLGFDDFSAIRSSSALNSLRNDQLFHLLLKNYETSR